MLTAFLVNLTMIAFLIKTDSSKGRLLIYKISVQILSDFYVKGVGLGNFALKYSDYQLEYFRKGNYTTKELLLADNTIHAFNDYLQFVIETGVAGIVVLVLAFAFFWWILFGKLIAYNSELKKVFAANLLIIGVSAMFTHVLCHDEFKIIFIISVIGLICLTFNKILPVINILALLLVLLILFYKYQHIQKQFKSQNAIKQARQLFDAGFVEEAYNQTTQMANHFQKDVDFLSTYADILIFRRQYMDASKVLHTVEKIKRTNAVYAKIAKVYFLLQDFNNAEAYYIKAVYLVPNRFSSRYTLFDFYIQTKQFKKAENVGIEILNLPAKIKSYRVDRIKKNVEIKLCQLRI